MDFIDQASDNAIKASKESIEFANQYLTRAAEGMGLTEADLKIPASPIIKRLGEVIALRETAISLIGSDPTAYADGLDEDDIYYRKYKLYSDTAKQLESTLTYTDFAKKGVDDDGKGGVGSISISRA